MYYPLISEKYKIISQIGNGKLGKSYLVVDNDTSNLLVFKIIENDNIWKSIKDKSYKMIQISNSNITKIQRIEEINLHKCIIQEFVYGDNLYDFIQCNDLHLGDFLFVSYSLLNAINELNKLGLSHKDVKPRNIIYNKKKKICKLIDLDFCVLESQDKKYMGTLKYSAPEQILSCKPSTEADLYSVGLVLCFMIIGRVPFKKDVKVANSLVKKMLYNRVDEIFEKNEKTGLDIVALINGLLEYDVEKRITLQEAIIKLKEIIKICVNQKNESLLILDYKKIKKYISEDENTTISFMDESLSIIVENTAQIFSRVTDMDMPIMPDFYFEPRSDIENTVNTEDKSTEDKKKRKETEDNKYIYRKQLLREYDNILIQAKVTFFLWVFSFVFCFCIIIISVFYILNGNYIEGVFTSLLDATILIVQKLFNIREDHYRELIDKKMKHLQKGDFIEYAFSEIDKIEDSHIKVKKQSELIDVMRKIARMRDDIK